MLSVPSILRVWGLSSARLTAIRNWIMGSGGSTTDLVGFHGTAATAQRAGAAQGAVTGGITAALTGGANVTAATANGVLADSAATNPTEAQFNELSKEVMTFCNLLRTDVLANTALVNELRAAMVAKGLIKGAA